MVLITTSRRPTRRIRTLCNDLERVIPDAVKVNRGKLSVEGVFEKASEVGMDRIIIVERWKGGAGSIKLYTLPPTSEAFFTLYLTGIKTQKEVGRRRGVGEGLIVTVEKNASASTIRLAEVFAEFLRVPLLEVLPENTCFKASIHFSVQEKGVKIAFTMPPTVSEIGPTLTVRYSKNIGDGGEPP